ncbi:DNRLRE domain-containing protein, partial [Clostridium neonatale]|uniref:DNRLRE domain-containing protein n=1 Tax=Clostridium neonatale TaxID=137838 RepID=UPI001B39610F|nr:DNRLRE domain-containing protein [Clostridium neonatale]
MAYSVRVNCENSTYVSKSHSNTNYSNDKSLIVSLLKEQDSKVNASISLLAFPALNLEFNNINHAYLYLFLEDIKTITNKSTKLNIISDFDYIDIKNVNWNNYSGDSLSNKLSIEISVSQINSYIKFDVTDLINNLSKFDINYNLLISPITPSTSTFVKFSSCNSNNPPYLVLEKFEDDYSKLSTENTYDNATTSNDKNTYTKDITLDYENSYDDAKALSDEHTYNEKSNNYEITNDIIDNINLDSEDNIDTSNYINFKDNEYSTDSHLNIDFDYDSNDNNSNDLPPNNNNFNEIIEKIDNIYNKAKYTLDKHIGLYNLVYLGSLIKNLRVSKKYLQNNNLFTSYEVLIRALDSFSKLYLNLNGYTVSKDAVKMTMNLNNQFNILIEKLFSSGEMKENINNTIMYIEDFLDMNINVA